MTAVPPETGALVAPFENVDSQEIPPCAPVRIAGVAVAEGVPFLQCAKANVTFTTQYAVNGQTRVPAGAKGLCFRGGEVCVAYDSGTPALGEGWGPKPGQWTISKGFPGCRIVGIVDSVNKIALVELLPITTLLGKTTGAITGGTPSTSYRIYAGGTLGSETDAGFTTVPSALSLIDLDSDEWIALTFLANGWRMTPLGCAA